MVMAWFSNQSSLRAIASSSLIRNLLQSMSVLFQSSSRLTPIIAAQSTFLSGAQPLSTKTSCSMRRTCAQPSLSSTEMVVAPSKPRRSLRSSDMTSTQMIASGKRSSLKLTATAMAWLTLTSSKPCSSDWPTANPAASEAERGYQKPFKFLLNPPCETGTTTINLMSNLPAFSID